MTFVCKLFVQFHLKGNIQLFFWNMDSVVLFVFHFIITLLLSWQLKFCRYCLVVEIYLVNLLFTACYYPEERFIIFKCCFVFIAMCCKQTTTRGILPYMILTYNYFKCRYCIFFVYLLLIRRTLPIIKPCKPGSNSFWIFNYLI